MGFMSDLLAPRVPVILQSEAPECGIACLAMVASYHGHRTDLSAMRLRLSPSLKGITLKNVAQIAETMGMTARGVQVPLEALGKLRLPAVLHWDMNHFVVLTNVAGRKITVHDPARGKRVLTLDEASRHFTGVAMEFTPTTGFQKKDEREKIKSWQLLGAASGLKGTIAQILVLSFALEVFAIAMPFFLQLTVDRVIVGRDVRIEAARAAHVELAAVADRVERAERVVHGRDRDRREAALQALVQLLRRGMRLVTDQALHDRQALRREAQPRTAQRVHQGGGFRACTHSQLRMNLS